MTPWHGKAVEYNGTLIWMAVNGSDLVNKIVRFMRLKIH
jgi:hypothetical protein